ncbi:hypothetical protein ABPG72_009318 [Tetrahymena utriculariae]
MKQQENSFYNLKDFMKSNLKALTSIDLRLKNCTQDDKQKVQLNSSLKKCCKLESLILILHQESVSKGQINSLFFEVPHLECLIPSYDKMTNDQRYSHIQFLLQIHKCQEKLAIQPNKIVWKYSVTRYYQQFHQSQEL